MSILLLFHYYFFYLCKENVHKLDVNFCTQLALYWYWLRKRVLGSLTFKGKVLAFRCCGNIWDGQLMRSFSQLSFGDFNPWSVGPLFWACGATSQEHMVEQSCLPLARKLGRGGCPSRACPEDLRTSPGPISQKFHHDLIMPWAEAQASNM